MMKFTRCLLALLGAALLYWPMLAGARDHVLIMTISNYNGTTHLPGAQFDAGHARSIAQRLGFDTSGALVLRDEQLKAAGLRAAIGRLSTDVLQNDRVFVYFSGHGKTEMQGGRWVTGLVAQDSGFVGLVELRAQLESIKQRTREVWVLFDTCHSGGLRDLAVHRSGSDGFSLTTNSSIRDTSWAGVKTMPPDHRVRAAEAVQVQFWLSDFPLTQQDTAPDKRLASMPESNFTFLAAASEREVALDDDTRGGMATVGLLACLESGVPDTDGSGQVSTKEWIQCAQQRVRDDMPAFNSRRGTQHQTQSLQAYGNVERALPQVGRVEVPACAAPSSQADGKKGSAGDTAPSASPPLAAPRPSMPAAATQLPPAPAAPVATAPAPTVLASPVAAPPAAGAAAPSAATAAVTAPCLPEAVAGSSRQSPLAARTIAAFRQIAAGSNGNWSAQFSVSTQRVRMGDQVEVKMKSAQGGYLTLLYVGSDGKDIRTLLSNREVRATDGRVLGRPVIADCDGGCPGNNTLMFVLSSQPLDAGQFTADERDGKVGLSEATIARLHCLVNTGKNANDSLCRKRNIPEFQLLDDMPVQGYVAQVLTVEGY